MMKTLTTILRTEAAHWVGDGFPVRTLFAYPEHGRELSPFLLLDHAGPVEFPPTSARRGVGEHPHRGFETVTIVHDGEVEHRDSSGGGGQIGPGDVQWMTAASGVVHEEFHGRAFAARGGRFEMVQLWVNLPAKDKMTQPRYQAILDAQIPKVPLAGGGTARVIAGEHLGAHGPALTHTRLVVVDLRLAPDTHLTLAAAQGWNAALVVLEGAVDLGNTETEGTAKANEVAVFDRDGTDVAVTVGPGATRALWLAGEPIEEPIAGSGPFVMNTAAEIRQAMLDYRNGLMGHLP